MGFFDLFRNRNTPRGKTEVAPGIVLSKQLAPYWPQIEATRMPCINIEATPAYGLAFSQSKFGGAPMLPNDFPYPTDSHGQKMFPLAQLNLSEMPALEGYPNKGWLQFYTSTNDVYGLDFDHPNSQKDFRVLYFENIDADKIQENFDFIEGMYEQAPIVNAHALRFTAAEQYVSVDDIRFDKTFGMDPFEFADTFGKKRSDAIHEELFLQFPNTGHRVGGYAYFTQEDPRKYYTEFRDYILLLQIDSTEETGIMWGDMGVANFFIHPDQLAKKDFSSVVYNWDCS